MSLRYFGTDGIRGPYGSDTLNDSIAYRAGLAAVRVARDHLQATAPCIAVGRDTRDSGERLLMAFAQGVAAESGTVLDLGIAPTPCVAFAARTSEAVLACSITASHNPAADNGIKFFEGSGVKPSEALEQALDDAIGQASADGREEQGGVELRDGSDFREAYLAMLQEAFPAGLLSGKRIALDCANGAMYELGPKMFRSLGADLVVLGSEPDGANINAGVGSEHPEAILSALAKEDFDFGIAFDGDGDRVVAFDENGVKLAGEALLAILAIDAKERGLLKDDTLVTTIQSNLGLDSLMKERSIQVERTNVGDKHIARLMVGSGFSLGGEESGHVVLGRIAITGDGLAAAVGLAEVVSRSGKTLSEWAANYSAFPQSSIALKVAEKRPLEQCDAMRACIASLEEELGSDGRLLVRYSGTEPKIRLLVEARNQEIVTRSMDALRESASKDLQLI